MRVAGPVDVVVDRHVHVRRDVEESSIALPVRARGALLQQLAQLGHVLGREEGGHPAVGDLAGELRCSSARSPRCRSASAPAPARSSASAPCPGRRAAAACRSRRRTPAARAPAPCAGSPRTRACAGAAWRTAGRASPRPPAGPTTRCPRIIRPFEMLSSVAAVIAVIAGVRPGIWKIAEPIRIRSVLAASHASTVAASEP